MYIWPNTNPMQRTNLPKSTLIISVYKNVAFLKVILDALGYQTHLPDEILVSEDGESAEMTQFLGQYKSLVPIYHLTQRDEGWQKNKALNRAIQRATYDYLLFIDGDCVLHPKFIENHLRLSGKNHILAGKRVKLGPKYSNLLKSSPLPTFTSRIWKEAFKIKKDGAAFFEEGLYIPLHGVTRWIIQKAGISSIKGCNFSCYKTALLAINGFDEDYIRPAIGEDIDLVWRFKGLGFRIISIKHFAVQYHLDHPESWVSQEENVALMKYKQSLHLYRCINGIVDERNSASKGHEDGQIPQI
jgi:GT2 family glycosyltransferase